jgi:alpha-glucosidase (family GH31 glycosyl hydrolase)
MARLMPLCTQAMSFVQKVERPTTGREMQLSPWRLDCLPSNQYLCANLSPNHSPAVLRIAAGLSVFVLFLPNAHAGEQEQLSAVSSTTRNGRSIILITATGQRVRITPYGDFIIRVQAVRKDEGFFPDSAYEMVESHDWDGTLSVTAGMESMVLQPRAPHGITLRISRSPLRIGFAVGSHVFLQESTGISWQGGMIHETFSFDSSEHFTGLGHSYYGRSPGIDLRNGTERRNYGTGHGQQAPLIVPFYLSSKGYGVFLNAMAENSFSFGEGQTYAMTIDGHGFGCRMDYFVILGPEFPRILDRYTQLTGRPRFPPEAVFGLGLSDKGNDEYSRAPSDERWWKDKVTAHRAAGFPIDHLINDNRWRAGGGKRCESFFAWDSVRYPDPAGYERWLDHAGLITTLDFNRCIARQSEGWKQSFNLPETDSVEFGNSSPDLTKKDVRQWWWELLWKKTLNPDLHYPGDALWIDEFDELGAIPDSAVLGNGTRWTSVKNYWFFLVAKALVQQGWDVSDRSSRRPFVWVRGMTAGAQRDATLWSGDIQPTYDEMKSQIRGMQLAGLSGFPFWGHDAGGFFNYTTGRGPDDTLYQKWSMAMGSFSPFWKPHGPGESRWPLDRSPQTQSVALKYARLRYQLMPYTYTAAHQAARTGLPVVRAMVIDHQLDPRAWQFDLEYMWGDDILVAPDCSPDDSVRVWLPEGRWYDFWSDRQLNGEQIVALKDTNCMMPLFVKAGALVPMAPYALSTATLSRDSLILNVYVGSDGQFTLYEDDGTTEAYRTRNEYRATRITYRSTPMSLTIYPAAGTFDGAPGYRSYRVDFHGLPALPCLEVDGLIVPSWSRQSSGEQDAVQWDNEHHCLSIHLHKRAISSEIRIEKVSCGERQ